MSLPGSVLSSSRYIFTALVLLLQNLEASGGFVGRFRLPLGIAVAVEHFEEAADRFGVIFLAELISPIMNWARAATAVGSLDEHLLIQGHRLVLFVEALLCPALFIEGLGHVGRVGELLHALGQEPTLLPLLQLPGGLAA